MRECAAGLDSCSCCLILRDVSKLRTKLDATLARLESESSLATRSLGRLEAGRAAFSVSLLKDGGFRCIGPFGGDEVVIYEHVFLNLGGHYNGSTGVFTVPQAGLYTFAVTLHSDAGAPRSPLAACTGLQVNGRVAAEAREQNADDQEDSATAVVLLQLNAGDAVAVKLLKGCFLCDESHYNTFSAFLLY
ncbi:hypothetical protein F2P81_017453 [Scophthalmus maximus]|uniref:C1q domain-containing protein n=1 Tax=Scophthalmus maximus TaxID=52904 RepID=A0A6A4SK37_SCOMX|nr:hypothetical protein F2P81_017453 [Scophthalmus maximus]